MRFLDMLLTDGVLCLRRDTRGSIDWAIFRYCPHVLWARVCERVSVSVRPSSYGNSCEDESAGGRGFGGEGDCGSRGRRPPESSLVASACLRMASSVAR